MTRGEGHRAHRGGASPLARRADPARAPLPKWLPGVFTGLRFALIPVLLLLAEATRSAVAAGSDGSGLRGAAIATLLGIGLTDVLDGWSARRRAVPPGRAGAVVDAAADRLFQWCATAFLVFRAEPAFTPLPGWLLAVIVLRDAALALAWLRARRRGPPTLEHAVHGKVALVAMFAVLAGSLAGVPQRPSSVGAAVAAALAAFSTVLHALRLARTAPG